MQRTALYILIASFIIIIVLYVNISNAIARQKKADSFNSQYEMYLNRKLSGTEIATILNKAIENNEKNNNPKDDKGFYIDNNETTIKVELNMINYGQDDEILYNTYQMEAINGIGIQAFLANYNTAKFKCTHIDYHAKTGQVSKITIEQQPD